MQFTGGFFWPDRQGLFHQHVAGVETDIHVHRGDAGLRFTVYDRLVDRRGATVLGQQ